MTGRLAAKLDSGALRSQMRGGFQTDAVFSSHLSARHCLNAGVGTHLTFRLNTCSVRTSELSAALERSDLAAADLGAGLHACAVRPAKLSADFRMNALSAADAAAGLQAEPIIAANVGPGLDAGTVPAAVIAVRVHTRFKRSEMTLRLKSGMMRRTVGTDLLPGKNRHRHLLKARVSRAGLIRIRIVRARRITSRIREARISIIIGNAPVIGLHVTVTIAVALTQ